MQCFEILVLALFSVTSVYHVNCAKILGMFPMAAYSHYRLGSILLKELAARGHDVTFISAFPQKTPVKNFKDVDVSGAIDMEGGKIHNFRH